MLLLSFFLAAALPDANSTESIGWFVGVAAAAALAYREISAGVRRMSGRGDQQEITNDPLNVRVTAEFASRHELHALQQEVHSIAQRLVNLPDAMSAASEDRLTRVHSRIDELQAQMSAMPNQIVALLKNTGAL
jgi:predicted  nucleic acid-binding Zn-ribbon protein